MDIIRKDDKSRDNFERYITLLPTSGFISTLILLVLFFLIQDVKQGEVMVTLLYALFPFVVFTGISIPIKVIMYKNSKDNRRKNDK